MAARAKRHGVPLRERLVAFLPRYAPYAASLPRLMNMRNWLPGARIAGEWLTGFSARRALPRWRFDAFLPDMDTTGPGDGPEVALFADTFNRWFEPDNAHAAVAVLAAAGYRVHLPRPDNGTARPLCCGRTFLSAGLIEEARAELARTVAALAPLARRGVPILGLEPSCLFTLKDELAGLMPGPDTDAVAGQAMLIDSFLAAEAAAGRLNLDLAPIDATVHLHGHCHQKAYNVFAATQAMLALIPDLKVETIESSCCGMAGAFGYQAETHDISMAMAELSLLPAIRAAAPGDLVVAGGTSCRHQIADGSGRSALHAIRLIERAVMEHAGPGEPAGTPQD
jgi:Fe-S oxidoreductase